MRTYEHIDLDYDRVVDAHRGCQNPFRPRPGVMEK